MNRLMETRLWFGRNPEAKEFRDYLSTKLEPLAHAESLHIMVDLKTGDVRAYTMYPSPLGDKP